MLLALPLLAAAVAGTSPASDTLREQIRAADTQLFAVAFDACDADRAAAMTTEDMEFFHDKDGKSANSREDFRRSVATLCDNARKGGWHLRRELVESSLQVFPLHDDRALAGRAGYQLRPPPGRQINITAAAPAQSRRLLARVSIQQP